MPLSGAALASRRSASRSDVCGLSAVSFMQNLPMRGSIEAHPYRRKARASRQRRESGESSFLKLLGRSLPGQDIADLLQQDLLARRLGGLGGLLSLLLDQPVESADHHEQ